MQSTHMHAEEGATAVEYALMVSFIAMAIVTAVTALGLTLNGIFASMAVLL